MADELFNLDITGRAVAMAMHAADCNCTDYIQGDAEWGDPYYDMLATAAMRVVDAEIKSLRAQVAMWVPAIRPGGYTITYPTYPAAGW